MRVAGAPISWGVCEVPGWGWQMPAHRVLAEMAELGLAATEFGPDGFLTPEAIAGAGLKSVGGFVPVVLHEPLPDLGPMLSRLAGADVLVLAAATGREGYDSRPSLDADGWRLLLSNLDELARQAAEHGLTAALHPHVGTMVEREDEVHRVLDGSRVPLCLDTGHLLIGGTDPAELAKQATDRIAHVHLKDVDAACADRVRAGDVAYQAAVADGMYRPLGAGDVDIAAIVGTLEKSGYAGWYVMEQDTVLTAEPPPGRGPREDVAASMAYLAKAV